jgi:hypothetical protein
MAKNMALAWEIYDHIEMLNKHTITGPAWDQEYWVNVLDGTAGLPDAEDVIPAGAQEANRWRWEKTKVVDPNICGTAFCFAGHVVNFTVDKPLFLVDEDGTGADFFDLDTGEIRDIARAAKEALDLTDEEADKLFAGSNSLGRLRDLLEEFEEANELAPVS